MAVVLLASQDESASDVQDAQEVLRDRFETVSVVNAVDWTGLDVPTNLLRLVGRGQYDLVSFLRGSDVLLSTDRFRRLAEALASNPKAGLAYHPVVWRSSTDVWVSPRPASRDLAERNRNPLVATTLPASACLIRAAALKSIATGAYASETLVGYLGDVIGVHGAVAIREPMLLAHVGAGRPTWQQDPVLRVDLWASDVVDLSREFAGRAALPDSSRNMEGLLLQTGVVFDHEREWMDANAIDRAAERVGATAPTAGRP